MMKKNLNFNERLVMWSKYFISTILVIVSYCVQAQTVQITGTVNDASTGLTIPGASVYVKGAISTGTVTNIDGKFTLNVRSTDQILVVSYIGYSTKEVLNVGSILTISLEPETQNIDELVVTALGIKREKKALGYSVGEVSSESISSAHESNVITALSGKVAGVVINSSSTQPGSAASIVEITLLVLTALL